RTGTNTGAASINYVVNGFFKTQGLADQNNEFPLQPGSDYATPTPATAGGIEGRNSDFAMSGGASGTLTWADRNFDPQPISFTVANNQLSEFNKDFQIFLYDVVNNSVVQVGMVAST